MKNEDLLEPKKLYDNVLKQKHLQNSSKYFEDLSKKANIDTASNKETCKKYYTYVAQGKKLKKQINNYTGGMISLIVLGSICIASIIIPIMILIRDKTKQSLAYCLPWILLGIILGLFFIIFFSINFSKKKKLAKDALDEVNTKAEEQLNIAYSQMAPLNNLYDWDMHIDLFKKTLPNIELDKFFDNEKVALFEDKYDLKHSIENDESTLFVQSGSLMGNPFIVETKRNEKIEDHTYTGSLTISWTETQHSSNGSTYTVTRTQTLVATKIKPKPNYYEHTTLYYGCEAAPKLSFSRSPTKGHQLDEKERAKFVKSHKKKIDEYAKKHPNFTPIGNEEFETFFNALDRDNEVEFRLLYTPLAQKNTLDLLLNSDPYGDDFTFVKKGMVNAISSSHSQLENYNILPKDYYHFDYEVAKENFLKIQNDFFSSLYFDLAPLLSIPLYQQMPSDEYIFKKKTKKNISDYEVESIANLFDSKFFLPDDCITDLILKTHFLQSKDNSDLVEIHSYGFRGEDRVDFVTKMGGDGHLHEVPVPWVEYFPVDRISYLRLQKTDLNHPSYNGLRKDESYKEFLNKFVDNDAIIFKKGIFSFIPTDKDVSYSPLELNEILKKHMNK